MKYNVGNVTQLDERLKQYVENSSNILYNYTLDIPDGITKIRKGAFYGSRTRTVNIPDSVERIDSAAFSYSHNREINCPACYIDTDAFLMSDISYFYMRDSGSYYYPEIEDFAFQGCGNLSQVKLSKNLKTLGRAAFTGCSSLTSITYTGTTQEWANIIKHSNWDEGSSISTIFCSNGAVSV